jgi:heavy metal translocating P-type ATPase
MNAASPTTDSCTYCGLPMPKPLFGRQSVDVAETRYCCTGCRLAAALTQDTGESGAATWTMTSLGLSVFFSMSVMVFTVAHWMYGAYDLEVGKSTELSTAFGQLLQWLVLLFTTPVVVLLGKPLADDAVRNLRAGAFTSDLLLLTGVVASFIYSLWSVLRGSGPVYFETGCVILLAVTFGRWLTATGKLRTNAALDELQRLLPETATVLRGGDWKSISLDDVLVGDIVSIKAGERVPVDGRITSGTAAIDEQVFTGESAPVTRIIDEEVFAGTLNLDGALQARAAALPRQGAFGALVEAVRLARDSKGTYQILADKVSAAFFPVVAVIALSAFLGHGFLSGWPEGLLAALAVVLIACPCALALATPLAVWAAMGRAARQGILFRSGEALERLAKVDTIRFDKTGTLTTGTPRVDDLHLAEETSYQEFASRAKLLACESSHVFSRSIAKLLKRIPELDGSAIVRTVPGRGLETRLGNESTETRLGSWEWLTATGAVSTPRLRDELLSVLQQSRSIVAISWGGKIRGFFCLAEETRPTAPSAIHDLRKLEIDLAVLTGDRAGAAAQIGHQLQLPVLCELSPANKLREINALQARGSVVAMVGDGINDAPALTAADVGIALGCGTDVTRSSADVCLLKDDLTSLVEAIQISRKCVACIRGNLAWSFAYNSIGVVLAAAGYMHPSVAAVLMVVSSLAVLTRSMRMSGTRPLTALNGISDEPPRPLQEPESATPHEPTGLMAGNSQAAAPAIPGALP